MRSNVRSRSLLRKLLQKLRPSTFKAGHKTMNAPRLSSIPLFHGLTEEESSFFAEASELIHVPAGERLLTNGEPVPAVYYIIRGEVTVKVLDAQEIPTMVSVIASGGLVGWSALIPPHIATATLTTMTDVELYRFDAEIMRDLMEKNPQLGNSVLLNVSGVISQRLKEARRRLTCSLGRHTQQVSNQ